MSGNAVMGAGRPFDAGAGLTARGVGPRIKALWRSLPSGLRRSLHRAFNWTGLPCFAWYVTNYGENHAPRNFAGNLLALRERYPKGSPEEKRDLAKRFDAIANALVVRGGVTKTTYRGRQNIVLEQVLADEACRLHKPSIRVLDVPASTGIASLDSFQLLSRHCRVSRYALADLSFHVLYDRDRGCIFDEQGNLLQVRHESGFFSIYRPHSSGNEFSPLTRGLLFPLELRSRYLKKLYPFEPTADLVPIPLTHPAVEPLLSEGVLDLKKVDVFEEIDEQFDLILCFNLLQPNYFGPKQIARGTENLKNALSEDGLLVMGSPDAKGVSAHRVARKRGGDLVTVREGILPAPSIDAAIWC